MPRARAVLCGGEHLTRTLNADGYTVTSTTAVNRQSTYQVKFSPSGKEERITTLPDGTHQTTELESNGHRQVIQPDGMTQNVTYSADPRFSMQAPLPTALSVQTPARTQGTLTATRTVPGANPATPLEFTTQTDTVAYSDSVSTRTATRTYDKATRTFTDTSPANRQRTTTLDTQGRVTQQQQGNLTPTQFSYDSQGRLATRTQGARSSAMAYDPQGRLDTITDPAGRLVSFDYDNAGRVTRQILPDLREITYTYDPNGNVTSISPPGRPPHVFEYTTVNQEKKYTAPSVNGGGTMQTQYAYNADRQLTLITRPDGQSVVLDYDATGRLQTQTFPNPQSLTPNTLSYTYAPTTGNLASVTTTSGQAVTYAYDGSLLTSSTWSGPITGAVSWTYDNNYRKTAQSVNGGNTVTFTYDSDDLITGAGALTLTRNSNGLLTGTTLENVADTLTYTGFGEVATYQASASATAILVEQYTRDNLGRITQKTETISGVTTTYAYTYDPAGRLTEVKQNGVTTTLYTYDQNSNRVGTQGLAPAAPIAATYDDQDRLLTYGGNTYTYTANGELLTKTVGSQTTTYTYDVLGNLLRVDLPGGDRIDYLVDGENRRIGKKVNGVLVQGFLYENQLEPVAELYGDGSLKARFVYGRNAHVPDYLITYTPSTNTSTGTYRIISDHLGSPRLVIDTSTNTIVQRIDYDEFGNVLLDTNPGFQPFGFAGGIYDQHTKLTRFGARDYDAETGRWAAKDPLKFQAPDTNSYGYVLGDPVNAIDSSGLLSLGELSQNWAFAPILGSLVSGIENVLSQLRDNGAQCIDWGNAGQAALLGAFVSSLGPSGIVFGRAGKTAVLRGYKAGILNKGILRVGWSWNKGRNWFSIHGGKPYTTTHWHVDLIPGPEDLGLVDCGIVGGTIGATIPHITGDSAGCKGN